MYWINWEDNIHTLEQNTRWQNMQIAWMRSTVKWAGEHNRRHRSIEPWPLLTVCARVDDDFSRHICSLSQASNPSFVYALEQINGLPAKSCGSMGKLQSIPLNYTNFTSNPCIDEFFEGEGWVTQSGSYCRTILCLAAFSVKFEYRWAVAEHANRDKCSVR